MALSLLKRYSTSNKASPRSTPQLKDLYPKAIAKAASRGYVESSFSSEQTALDILPQLAKDPMSASCYIAQIEWCKRNGSNDVLCLHLGSSRSLHVQTIMMLHILPTPHQDNVIHQFEFNNATILDMGSFGMKINRDSLSAWSTVYYALPNALSLSDLAKLAICISEYGRQVFASQPAPKDWLPLITLHCIDEILQPEHPEQWAASQEKIAGATEPIQDRIKQDVATILEALQTYGTRTRGSRTNQIGGTTV